MTPHTITQAVGAVCRCKANTGLRCSPRGLHTQTQLSSLLRLNLDSSLKTIWFHSAAGCGSPVVKVSDHGRHVMSSSPVRFPSHQTIPSL
ncbi:uncharacterized protein TNCV_1587841 [Trichonephila clavipes]|uniref:Uncharacterized protein n=1 Tax=Trichonephila clavipes TaxID=2585209 RepID=A0A8X6RJA3_TRICX|nr:uncharacterized protein TNCV_1587841 [Trichonephila clavipes]